MSSRHLCETRQANHSCYGDLSTACKSDHHTTGCMAITSQQSWEESPGCLFPLQHISVQTRLWRLRASWDHVRAAQGRAPQMGPSQGRGTGAQGITPLSTWTWAAFQGAGRAAASARAPHRLFSAFWPGYRVTREGLHAQVLTCHGRRRALAGPCEDERVGGASQQRLACDRSPRSLLVWLHT